MLNPDERKVLLELARESVTSAVMGAEPPPVGDDAIFRVRGGAFVTLKLLGRLRGCIGSFTGTGGGTIGETVRDMAARAAVGDPRFNPVTPGELDAVRIQISLLSSMVPASPEEVVPGVHGVYIRRGHRAGTLLPQVASEEGWDRETLLAHACLKAGLPPHCHRDTGTEILVYTADVFGEQEERKP